MGNTAFKLGLLVCILFHFPAWRTCAGTDENTGKADFARDIQPIFKNHCLKCHGGEKPKGQLRLDARAPALRGGVSGKAILPGNAQESRLVQLLEEKDEEERMPRQAPPLAPEKIQLLRAWIDQGAEWPDAAAGDAEAGIHWAFITPARRDPPAVKNAARVRGPIDAFILARLEKEGIALSEEADRSALLKRLSYDLVGLPPEPEEVEAFLQDGSAGAYEKQVDRLLSSPHYGERWGRHWLDKARYADSDGYEKDNPRPDAWRWRDWVIDAFNCDLPFDRFTVEQLAGDLLPEAGPKEVLATAFHRQTLTNTEGGTDQEQFRVEAVFDRVDTTGAVWLGLTIGCARCHNHKFDPIAQREYYQLFAFFNNADETTAEVPVSDRALAEYAEARAAHAREQQALEARLEAMKPALAVKLSEWERGIQAELREEAEHGYKFQPLEVLSIKARQEVTFQRLEDGSYLAGGADPDTETYDIAARPPARPIAGFRVEALADKALPSGGPGRSGNGNFVLSELRIEANGKTVALQEPSADFSQKGFSVEAAIDGNPKTGWAVAPELGKSHHAAFRTAAPLALPPEAALAIALDQQHGERHTLGRFRLLAMTGTKPPLNLPGAARAALAVEPEKRGETERAALLDHFASVAPETAALAKEIAEHKKKEPKAPLMTARVLAQRRSNPRSTHILHRGDFLQPQEEVQAGTLAALHPLKPRGAASDRLDLARWLVDPENPLAARVAANHVWAALFGRGLVKTPNDFGSRGERPTHPELLDWLALEFQRLGWSQKKLLKTIVLSSTYRQSSRHRPELSDRDPLNLLLYRQNRFRVEGEVLRDLTLAASGLLSMKIGGPSVYPPMPSDIAALSYAGNFKWKNSEGEDRYRRGLYTFFKRTAPYPGLAIFDCPDSNTTCIQRRLSNTPLQALTCLNNEVFAEAAQAFARRLLARSGGDAERLSYGFKIATARAPEAAELEQLLDLLAVGREWYRGRGEEAKKLAGALAPVEIPVEETAAWTAAARILLNLDEFITRE